MIDPQSSLKIKPKESIMEDTIAIEILELNLKLAGKSMPADTREAVAKGVEALKAKPIFQAVIHNLQEQAARADQSPKAS